jgi:adenylate kinase
MALNLIMLGAPGAGKGTQAERLARARGIPKISTGDILREAVHEGTAVGKRAQASMDRGELVSDDLIVGIVRERLERPDARNGFVLDGFPRTVAQAVALDTIMNGRSALIVLDIAVPEAELVRRLASRQVCEDCGATAAPGDRHAAPGARCQRCGGRLVQRTDDNDVIVRNRLKVYHQNTEPLIEYYRGRPTFRHIDGAQAPDRVAEDLASAVAAAEASAGVGEGTVQ